MLEALFRQPRLRPARETDAHAVRRMAGEVAGDEPSDEACGTEHDDVEVALLGHDGAA